MIITINDFGGGSSTRYEVVTELPAEGKTGRIYLAPSQNPEEKDLYSEYVWLKDDGKWEQFGSKIDLSNYYNKAEVNGLLTDKQDTLISGENIKTINGEDILGEGDIEIKGDTIKAGDGIYISEDEEGAKVISTKPYSTTADTYVAWCDTDGNWTVDYYDNGIIPDYTKQTAPMTTSNAVRIEFGSGIKQIGNYAFYLGYRVYGLELELVLNEGLTKIGIYSFNYRKIKNIKIPSTVTSIDTGAFYELGSVTNDRGIYFSENSQLITIGQSAFGRGEYKMNTLIFPNSVTSIGVNAFDEGNKNIDNVIWPSGIKTINNAFYSTDIKNIEIPDSVTSIGGGALSYCIKLSSVEIPSSVTSIGGNAFSNCSGLTSITIGSGVTSIADYICHSCTSLTSVEIPSSVTSIGEMAFSNCSGLTSVTIPDSVTSIGGGAFYRVPTQGTLYCDEDWFNNLSSDNKSHLGNVANWTRKPLPKSIEERVDDLEVDVTDLTDKVNDLQLYKLAVDMSNLDDKGKEVIDDRIDAKIGNINSILENIIGG